MPWADAAAVALAPGTLAVFAAVLIALAGTASALPAALGVAAEVATLALGVGAKNPGWPVNF